jgi:hypothetical protein
MNTKITFVKAKDMEELAYSSKKEQQQMRVATHHHSILLVERLQKGSDEKVQRLNLHQHLEEVQTN